MRQETPGSRVTLEYLRQRRDEIIRIAAARGAVNVRIFSSVARGESDASSDVDLLVDLTTDVNGFAYFTLIEELEAELRGLLGCNVDVVEMRGPFSPEGQEMADRILENAVSL